MAKPVKKTGNSHARSAKAEPTLHNVSGTGFRKTFTASELTEIQTKRREMRSRLYAAG